MDNGYQVGYLDDGEFVEVGRFNNLDAVANSDLEIRHADSETRVVLGDEGFDFDSNDVTGVSALEADSIIGDEAELTNGLSFGSFTINKFSTTLDEDDSTTWIEIQTPRSDGRSSAIVFASLSGTSGSGLWQYSAAGDFSDRSNDDMNLSNSGALKLRLSSSTLEVRTDSTGFEDREVQFAVGKMRFS